MVLGYSWNNNWCFLFPSSTTLENAKLLFLKTGNFQHPITVYKNRQKKKPLLLHSEHLYSDLAAGPSLHDETLPWDWNNSLEKSCFLVLTCSLFSLSSDLITCNFSSEYKNQSFTSLNKINTNKKTLIGSKNSNKTQLQKLLKDISILFTLKNTVSILNLI